MVARSAKFAMLAAALAAVAACKTGEQAGNNAAPAGGTASDTTGGAGGTGGTSVPTLVNVNLQNVLNDLAVKLNISNANIPVNAQVPIDVAANVCGVSVSALSASIANGQASCTATTTSPTLIQSVQQQISAGGGSQTSGTNNIM
jgi:hypothetical protein